jgi:hypothetical protein
MLLLVVVCSALAAYWAGTRGQRYTQARADVRDTCGKLGKARKARDEVRSEALVGWVILLGILAVLVVSVAWRQ